MNALIPPAPKIFKFLALFLCLFNGAYSTPLGNGTRSVNSANLIRSNDDINTTVSHSPSMNSPKLPPSPTFKPTGTAAETPNAPRIIKKAEFISPSLFYQQGQMSVECPNQKDIMAIIRDYVGRTRRYPLPDLGGTGITAEEWNRQLDVWEKVIEDKPTAGKAKRYVKNLQKRCFACRCNPETARLVHETNALLINNPCSNRMIALKCEAYFRKFNFKKPSMCIPLHVECACTVPLIQPTLNATYRSVPLRYFQDAINRIPRYIRERAGDDWIWEVPSSMAEYEGQILRFTTPLWDPPSLPLENSEPLEPYFDVDRSLWADHDPNDPNPPPIRLYGPQANPVNLDFDLDDFLDFTGMGDQDMFDVPPGLEYEYGYGHGPHGYGYGFGEGSGGSGSGSGSGSGGGGSGSAKRDLGRRNKAYIESTKEISRRRSQG